MQAKHNIKSAFLITFNGDCRKALALYQSCFGGDLFYSTLEETISGMRQSPVVTGSLVSEKIIIYGSDLVHDEGRLTGNFMSFYVYCDNALQRLEYLEKLNVKPMDYSPKKYAAQKWIEITDPFAVRWVFGI